MSRSTMFFALLLPAVALAHWERISTEHAPSARGAGAACALKGGGMLIFGGSDAESSSGFNGETWLFENGDWVEVKSAGASPEPRSNAGCAGYGDGAVLFGGFVADASAPAGLGVSNETWLFTPGPSNERSRGTWRKLDLVVAPPARAYHSMTPHLGGALVFGGRNSVYTNDVTCKEDTWVFQDGHWREIVSTRVSTNVLQSTSRPSPSKRYGHIVACGLNASIPTERALNALTGQTEEFVGPADCMLFGGALQADEDFKADTWLLYRNNGNPVWKRQNNWPAPRGRWCHQATRCANSKGVVMVGGSIDYRVSDQGTWVWTPASIAHEESPENPGHQPGYTGKWQLADSGATGPQRSGSGFMVTDEKMGVLLFGGIADATGGNHPGHFTNDTWIWRGCEASSPTTFFA